MALQGIQRPFRRCTVPDDVDEAVSAYGPAHVERESGEQGLSPQTWNSSNHPVDGHINWSKKPYLNLAHPMTDHNGAHVINVFEDRASRPAAARAGGGTAQSPASPARSSGSAPSSTLKGAPPCAVCCWRPHW